MNTDCKTSPWLAICAGLAYFYEFLNLNLLGPLAPILMDKLHLSYAQIGILTTSYLFGITVSCVPIGILSNRFSPYFLLLFAMFASFILLFGFSTCKSLYGFIIFRFVSGIIHPIIFINSMKIMSINYKEKCGYHMGILLMMGVIGGSFTQYPLSFLLNYLNWVQVIDIIGIFGMLILGVIYFYFRINMESLYQCEKTKEYVAFKTAFYPLKSRQNLLFSFYAAFMNLPIVIIATSWGNLMLIRHYGMSEIMASSVIIWLYIGLGIGSVLFGFLSDYFKTRKKIMLISSLCLLLTLLLLFFNQIEIIYLSIVILFIGFFSGCQVLTYTCISEYNDYNLQNIGTSYVTIIIMGISVFLVPAIGFLVSNNTSSNNIILSLVILLLFNYLLTLFFSKDTYKIKFKCESN